MATQDSSETCFSKCSERKTFVCFLFLFLKKKKIIKRFKKKKNTYGDNN